MIATLIAIAGLAHPPAPHSAAWSYDGHRLICEIAWRELTPSVRERVRELLAEDSTYSSFPASCVWADEVRGGGRYPRYTTAHYVNLPRGAAGFDRERDCGSTYCVVEAIHDLSATLANPNAPVMERLDALKFLAHFVGDIHQPLHAGYGDDRGGNDVPVTFDGRAVNLHWLWDGLLSDQLGFGPDDAARLHTQIQPIDRALWADFAPERWAEESFQLVERDVYHGVQDGHISEHYVERNRYTVKRQILKAGVRLGALLNRSLGG